MSSRQFRNVVRKYGITAIGTYFSISTATFWGLYFAIENQMDVHGTLQEWGLLRTQTTEDEETLAENTRWYRRLISEGKGGSIALAFLCTKALVPIKIPIAMSITPIVHRWLQSMGVVKLHTPFKNP